MDCGHGEHDMSTIDNCSNSSCHNTEQPAVHANLYLLIPVSLCTSLAPLSAALLAAAAADFSPAYAPVAPPPKSLVS